MSRVGKNPIEVPSGVQIKVEGRCLKAKGPKGELSLEIPESISVKPEGQKIIVDRATDTKKIKSLHGAIRSLAANMVEGVSKGFEKSLQVIGVGYRANVKGQVLVLSIGFSHPVNYEIPQGIKITVGKDNVLTVSGCDKQLVGEVAAEIRAYYPPEPYKGKGIRYKDEWVHRKAGKAVVSE